MAAGIIEREAALSALAQSADLVRTGENRVIFLSGPAGCGKSALAGEALRRSGLRTYRARPCHQTSPYAYVRQLLAQITGNADALTDTQQDPSEQMAANLLRHLSEEAAALYLDDLQDADPGSLACLNVFSEIAAARPVLVLCTVRTDALSRRHPLRDLRGALRRSGRFQEIAVEPLNESGTRLLVEQRLKQRASNSLAAEIYRRTRGIAFLVEELVASLRHGGLREGPSGLELAREVDLSLPEASRELLLEGFQRLSEDGRAACEAAAIRGCDFALWELQKICEQEQGIDEALDAGLFEETAPGSAAFRQVLTQEAIYAAIPWSRRRRLHLLWAEFLEINGGCANVVAHHFENAAQHDKAREFHRRAGDDAVRLRAFLAAADSFSSAIRLWPETQDSAERADTLRQYAECARKAGQTAAAEEAWRQSIRFAEENGDASRAGAAWRGLADVLAMQGNDQAVIDAREAAARHFAASGQAGAAAEELLAASQHLTDRSRTKAAEDGVRRAIELAQRARDFRLQSHAFIHMGLVLAMQGKCAAAEREVSRGLDLALKHEFQDAAILGYRRMAQVHEYSSDYKGEHEFHQSAIRLCRTGGEGSMEHLCLGCMAYGQFRAGEWTDALKICADILSGESDPVGICIAEGVTGLVRLHRGELRVARRLLSSAEASCRTFGVVPMLLINGWAVGLVSEECGNPRQAADRYLEALRIWEKSDDRHDILPLLPVAAAFFGSTGDLVSLEQCAACARVVADTGNSEPRAVLAMVEGECALARQSAEEAANRFEEGLRLFAGLELPFESARARYRAGVARLKSEAREEAAELFANGCRDARNLGARPLASRILREMEAAGIPAGKAERTKRDGTIKEGLTPRQREVARLVSEGRTNKEIAERLFLSTRTVEMHVAHLLERLDCRSRSEAAGKLAGAGLLG